MSWLAQAAVHRHPFGPVLSVKPTAFDWMGERSLKVKPEQGRWEDQRRLVPAGATRYL